MPFAVRTPGCNKTMPKRAHPAPRFSLSLSQFSWLPAKPAPSTVRPCGDRVPAGADRKGQNKAGALARRFAALRAVLANPAPFAERIAAAAKARGLRVRRPGPLIPPAELWTLFRSALLRRALFQGAAHLNTS